MWRLRSWTPAPESSGPSRFQSWFLFSKRFRRTRRNPTLSLGLRMTRFPWRTETARTSPSNGGVESRRATAVVTANASGDTVSFIMGVRNANNESLEEVITTGLPPYHFEPLSDNKLRALWSTSSKLRMQY